MDDAKTRYREKASSLDGLAIFSQPWWLDAVCGAENWGVTLYEKGGQLVGALPYFVKKKLGLSAITMPKMTQHMGPWIRYFEGQKRASRLSHEKEVFTQLVEKLPKVSFTIYNLSNSISNWLPFYWMGFSATPRYTYVIDELSDLESLWDGFDSGLRGMIRKARKNGIIVEETDDLSVFLKLHRMTYERQGVEPPQPESLLRRVDDACKARDARSLYVARDQGGRAHSGVYCVYDQVTTYYLMSGADPELRNSGANGLALWKSIQDAAARDNERFDFEGSMKQSIERFFRDFGARQKLYYHLYRASTLGLALKTLHMTVQASIGRRSASEVFP